MGFNSKLTNNSELDKITSNWLGVDLTLVSTRVPLLNVLNLENPLVTGLEIARLYILGLLLSILFAFTVQGAI